MKSIRSDKGNDLFLFPETKRKRGHFLLENDPTLLFKSLVLVALPTSSHLSYLPTCLDSKLFMSCWFIQWLQYFEPSTFSEGCQETGSRIVIQVTTIKMNSFKKNSISIKKREKRWSSNGRPWLTWWGKYDDNIRKNYVDISQFLLK